jgi:hypothetical protein
MPRSKPTPTTFLKTAAILALFLFLHSCAQTSPSELNFRYIDKSGNEVIKGPFNWAEDFAGGLARVKIMNKGYGYIDHTGKFIIEPQFGHAHDFSQGLARASRPRHFKIEPGLRNSPDPSKRLARTDSPENYNYGYIDKQGKWILPPQYMEASDFSEDLAWVGIATKLVGGGSQSWGRKSGYINKQGQFVFAIDGTRSIETSSRLSNAYSESCQFKDGIAPFLKTPENQWGYINKTGKFVIKPKFEDACGFVNGFARVKTQEGIRFINRKGQFISKAFSQARDFADGMAAVQPSSEWHSKWGYINTDGQMVIKPQFDQAANFAEGCALVSVFTKKINTNTEAPTWDVQLQRWLGLGRYSITNLSDQKTWIIDRSGKKIDIDVGSAWPPDLTLPCFSNQFSEGLIGARRDSRVGFIDKTGKVVIPAKWQSVGNFHEGLAHVLCPPDNARKSL